MPTKAQLLETVARLEQDLRQRGRQLASLHAELAHARAEVARLAPERCVRPAKRGKGAPGFVRAYRERLHASATARQSGRA